MSTEPQPPTQAQLISDNIAKRTLPGSAFVLSSEHLLLALGTTDLTAAIDEVRMLLPVPAQWECPVADGKVSFRHLA